MFSAAFLATWGCALTIERRMNRRPVGRSYTNASRRPPRRRDVRVRNKGPHEEEGVLDEEGRAGTDPADGEFSARQVVGDLREEDVVRVRRPEPREGVAEIERRNRLGVAALLRPDEVERGAGHVLPAEHRIAPERLRVEVLHV